MRLGFWQLSRAEQKTHLQQAIERQAQLPPLNLAQLQTDPTSWGQTHRRVSLQGEWLNDKTVFLDNRAHHGRVGFWVMTPLRVQAGQVVWVQRGWVERDPLDPRKVPSLSTPAIGVTIDARIAPALSQIFELRSDQPEAGGQPIAHKGKFEPSADAVAGARQCAEFGGANWPRRGRPAARLAPSGFERRQKQGLRFPMVCPQCAVGISLPLVSMD